MEQPPADQQQESPAEARARLAWWAILDELDRRRALMQAGQPDKTEEPPQVQPTG